MVGTAGHIDHGKSSLVRALTGTDPDRLKEEQERGLTIDLGFASLKLNDGRLLGLIDVPGHERFVRNMVAGSTGLDLAVLVVAADDGVMPQTEEHLDIIDLLGVRRGVIALTKIDLVDEEVAQLAEDEIRERVAGTVLQDAPLLRVSSTTGEGVPELSAAIEALALDTPPRPATGSFRMPIQRVFQLKGIGTVVTGVPVAGAIESGGQVEFLPGAARSKVRALQAFGGKVARAVAGHSAALSVPDVRASELSRGVVAVSPGVYSTGNAVDVELRLLPRALPFEHRREVRFHTGTVETQGLLLLLDRDRLGPGEEVVARVLLTDSLCCAPGDRFLLRLQNPVVTVGGGTVLRLLDAPRRYRRRMLSDELERLHAAGASIENRVHEELTMAGVQGLTPGELAATLAIDTGEALELMHELDDVHFHERGGRAFLTDVLAGGIAEVEASVGRMLRDRPLAASVKRASFRHSRALPAVLLEAALDELVAKGKVRTGTQGVVTFVDRLKPLSPVDADRLRRVEAVCQQRRFRPATPAEMAAAVGESASALEGLLARAADEGRIERVGDHLYDAATLRRALRRVRQNCLRNDDVLDIPSLRDEFDTSRKFLIPLLEYVDGTGLTRLRGGVRVLLPSSAIAEQLAAEDGAAGGE